MPQHLLLSLTTAGCSRAGVYRVNGYYTHRAEDPQPAPDPRQGPTYVKFLGVCWPRALRVPPPSLVAALRSASLTPRCRAAPALDAVTFKPDQAFAAATGLKNVFVKHFSATAEKEDLSAVFHSLGVVKDVHIWTVPHTSTQSSWRFGVVRVATTSAAIEFLSRDKLSHLSDRTGGDLVSPREFASEEAADGVPQIMVTEDPTGKLLDAAKRAYAEAEKLMRSEARSQQEASEKATAEASRDQQSGGAALGAAAAGGRGRGDLDSRVARIKRMGVDFTKQGDRVPINKDILASLDLRKMWGSMPSVLDPPAPAPVRAATGTTRSAENTIDLGGEPEVRSETARRRSKWDQRSVPTTPQPIKKAREISVPAIQTNIRKQDHKETVLRNHFENEIRRKLSGRRQVERIKVAPVWESGLGAWLLEFESVEERDTAFELVDGSIFAYEKLKLKRCNRTKFVEETAHDRAEEGGGAGAGAEDSAEMKHEALKRLILLKLKARITKDMKLVIDREALAQVTSKPASLSPLRLPAAHPSAGRHSCASRRRRSRCCTAAGRPAVLATPPGGAFEGAAGRARQGAAEGAAALEGGTADGGPPGADGRREEICEQSTP